ncbi:MAG: hypothetical protein Hals2KO_12050 [Halioglobus sp.]
MPQHYTFPIIGTGRHALLTAAALSVLLTACGGGGGGSAGNTPGDTGPVQSFGLLKPVASDAELAATLRRGLTGASTFGEPEALITAPESDLAGDSGGAGAGFSTTNLQEAGVDEADRVKYDGDILYVLDYAQDLGGAPTPVGGPEPTDELVAISFAPGPFNASIRLLRTDTATPGIEALATINFESDSSGGALYLTGDDDRQLINVGYGNGYHWSAFAFDYYWQDQNTQVRAWNVGDPENPTDAWQLELQGSLLTSRIVDQVLYLVTRHTPHIDGLVPYPATAEEQQANQALLDAAALDDLMPDVAFDNGEPTELLAGTDCYVPNEAYEELPVPPASGSIITISAIDLRAPQTINSVCLNGFANGFYVSPDSLYITSYSAAERTVIHKVGLADGNPQYLGSGDVPGYLGTSNPAFLMSESGADLRVVSSTWDNVTFPVPDTDEPTLPANADADSAADLGRHRLTVLRENTATRRLETIASLPNAQRPGHIGKPGEDLYAARFLGDRAYLVTFQTIDPLYVVDLANPQDPKIAGELELPGFSTQLQPLGEELLLGVGQEVSIAHGAVLTQGVKVALFNVADITNPIELSSQEIGKRGSYSPALDDHHALTLLEADGVYRLALPVARHDEDNVGNTPFPWYGWSDNALHQFEIDPATGSLEHRGSLISEQHSAEQPWPNQSLYNSRSVLHDEAVFFVTQPDVVVGRWGE